MPVLGDVYNILRANPETKRLANILSRLVNGSASTFNQQTNVDLSNKYTVLDISELTGDLLTVGMYVALDFVWDKAKEDRTVAKAIFIDAVSYTHLPPGCAISACSREFRLSFPKRFLRKSRCPCLQIRHDRSVYDVFLSRDIFYLTGSHHEGAAYGNP